MEKIIIDKDRVSKVKRMIYSKKQLNELAFFFKVFGDETRLRIINALSICSMCVSDIAWSLNMSQSSISHQLKSLRAMNLVQTEKNGKVVYYKLSDNHILDIFDKGYEHISERGENNV